MPVLSSEITFFSRAEVTVSALEMRVIQRVFAHDMLVAEVEYINPVRRFDQGTPVLVRWGQLPGGMESFFGYVHYTEPVINPLASEQKMRVVCIGTSEVMKLPLMESWQNRNSSSIVREVVRRFRLSGQIQESNDAISSLTWNGKTAWQLLAHLAKTLGWTLYCSRTDVVFKDPLAGVQDLMETAPAYVIPARGDGNELNRVFKFDVIDGELAAAGGIKAERILHGLDPRTLQEYGVSNDTAQFTPSQLGQWSGTPRYQRYVTGAATPLGDAVARLEGVQAQNRWHIQAKAEVVGSARVHQGILVFIGGVPKRERGYWYVEEVEHRIGGGEYRMMLTLGRDSRFTSQSTQTPSARRVVRQRYDPFGQQKAVVPGSLLINDIWRAEYGAERQVPGVA